MLKDVLLALKGSQTQVPFRVLDGKDGHLPRKDKRVSRYLIAETCFSKKLPIGFLVAPKPTE